ncbi:Uma2 family endonuclease [Spirulina subsalsa]|uniref:Uma2 family endonuclease n=1 Tax=Spirulina subsalsa TaxID=54311 RepID=UPI0002E528F9|nr:Uma2 family endonuclease [Spirulina subsalsa]
MTIATEKQQTQKLTLTEFLALPETEPACEFFAGEVSQKPMPKGRHSCLQYEVCNAINQVAKRDKIAYAFPELRCTFGDRSFVPDIAVFQWHNIPFLPDGEVPDRFEIPPDWVIEILSPEQKVNQVIAKILYCMEQGSQLGWFVDPDDRSILVFWCDRPPVIISAQNSLPTLAGIELNLTAEQIVQWLKMGL